MSYVHYLCISGALSDFNIFTSMYDTADSSFWDPAFTQSQAVSSCQRLPVYSKRPARFVILQLTGEQRSLAVSELGVFGDPFNAGITKALVKWMYLDVVGYGSMGRVLDPRYTTVPQNNQSNL